VSYTDSKFHVVLLSQAVAGKWPDVYSNAVDPGWVPTKMGGPGAPDNLKKGYETQVWLAVSDDAKITGQYFFHQNRSRYLGEADSVKLQEQFLARCRQITGVKFPG
jgi:NAD(P)-dependent dehydrogenase (short-subunit alcohol dehydrogenase family)